MTSSAKLRTIALGLGALSTAILTWVSPASAQLCINSPSFVPGLSGPPIWSGSSGTVRIDLNDPRWANAVLTRFPQDPTGSEAAFRIIKSGNQLSVSFHAITDPAISANDAIYFGFSESGTVAHVARINLPSSGVEPIAPTIFHAWDRSAGTWTDSGAVKPSWLTEPAAWRRAATAPTNPGDPGYEAVKAGVAWGINFKVDLPSAASTTDFRVFLGMHVTTSSGSIDYYRPDYPGGTSLITGTIVPQGSDTTAWQSVTALGTACASGISLSWSNMGTTNTPSSAIDTSPGSTNVFFADPSGIASPVDNKVLAKFRIAHWGSTIADPQAPWTDITGATAVASVGGTSHIHTFNCVPSGSGTCPTLGSGEDPHQCMLVELRAGSAAPAGLQFETPAAYRNMDFADLSTLSRTAQISIKGLQTITGQAKERDVYLYVKESNLPPHGNDPIWLPGGRMASARRFAEEPPPVIKPRVEKPKDVKLEKPVKGVAAVPPKPQAPQDAKAQVAPEPAAAQAPPAQQPSEFGAASPHEALVSVWPTYEVHVYYDTGTVVKIDGQDQKVLRPMVPFGFFLQHDGPLYGFTSAFEAQNGVVLQELSPHFYKVTIPNEGSISVETTITAEEKPKSATGGGTTPCPACPPKGHRCQCDVPGAPSGNSAWLVALVSAAMARLRRRRSRIT